MGRLLSCLRASGELPTRHSFRRRKLCGVKPQRVPESKKVLLPLAAEESMAEFPERNRLLRARF